MSWKAEARKTYERRILQDALERLARATDLKELPFSESEVQTLARRTRDAIFGSARARERLRRYKAHLASLYGAETVEHLALKLQDINNQIAWEEK
jgi:hypothetical protein